MNLLLEKTLRVAAQASKNGAYPCSNEVESHQECTMRFPMKYLQQEDVDALKTALLNERLNANEVTQMTNSVFQKFTIDHSIDEIFNASVSIEIYISKRANVNQC